MCVSRAGIIDCSALLTAIDAGFVEIAMAGPVLDAGKFARIWLTGFDGIPHTPMRAYARKVDTTQAAIVEAVRKAGWLCWIIEEPCDLLVFKHGIFHCIECKSPKNKRGEPRLDKRQQAQADFLFYTNATVAVTPEDALRALGELL